MSRGVRALKAEVARKYGECSTNAIKSLLEANERGYRPHEDADKILGTLFELVRADQGLRETVPQLPNYQAGLGCLEIACPGLVALLQVANTTRGDAAQLARKLAQLTISC